MPNTHITKNYFAHGGNELVVGGKLTFLPGATVEGGEGLFSEPMPNQAAATGTSGANAVTAINALLVKLKDAGLMAPDALSLTVTKDVTDSVAGHADRSYNTGKITSVSEEDGIITITLSEKVAALKEFDGGGNWGTHKWLGIGVSAGITPITDLYYNGALLTAEDVAEATSCGLSAGYFVRWVAADLVLAGDDSAPSKGQFTLWASGHEKVTCTLRIVEPNDEGGDG